MLGCQNIRGLGLGEVFGCAGGSWDLWEKLKVLFQVFQKYLTCPLIQRQQTDIELIDQGGCLCQPCDTGIGLWEEEGTPTPQNALLGFACRLQGEF